MPLDQDDDLQDLLDQDDTEPDTHVYMGNPALIVGDEIDDAVIIPPEDSAYHGGPRYLELARHQGGTPGAIGIELDEDTFGCGDALRSDKQGITG